MVQLMDWGPNVIACSVDGTVGRDDLEMLAAELDRKAASGARLRGYAEIGDLDGTSLFSLWQDLRAWSDRQHLVRQIDRAAVVTDNAWITQGLRFADTSRLGLEIKLFPPTDTERARAWLEG